MFCVRKSCPNSTRTPRPPTLSLILRTSVMSIPMSMTLTLSTKGRSNLLYFLGRQRWWFLSPSLSSRHTRSSLVLPELQFCKLEKDPEAGFLRRFSVAPSPSFGQGKERVRSDPRHLKNWLLRLALLFAVLLDKSEEKRKTVWARCHKDKMSEWVHSWALSVFLWFFKIKSTYFFKTYSCYLFLH